MKEKFTILIADRNRNIRDFLNREMTAEGYLVHTAKNGNSVNKLRTLIADTLRKHCPRRFDRIYSMVSIN